MQTVLKKNALVWAWPALPALHRVTLATAYKGGRLTPNMPPATNPGVRWHHVEMEFSATAQEGTLNPKALNPV